MFLVILFIADQPKVLAVHSYYLNMLTVKWIHKLIQRFTFPYCHRPGQANRIAEFNSFDSWRTNCGMQSKDDMSSEQRVQRKEDVQSPPNNEAA